MARRRIARKPLPQETVQATIESMSHEGRGVTHVNNKVVFIEGALTGEEVLFRYTNIGGSHDEGRVEQVLKASSDRVSPRCPHFGVCGGCSLQHISAQQQIELKQHQLLENFRHIGKVAPEEVLAPLTGPEWGYRRKARLGVRFVEKKGKVLVGFREKSTPYLADLSRCEVLHPSVGERIGELSDLIGSLEAYREIAQIEVAVCDEHTVLVFRNLVELNAADRDKLIAFAQSSGIHVYLQSGGPETAAPLWPAQSQLRYALPEYDVEVEFWPTDFTQVNAEINRRMVPYALALLDPQPDESVLDLFCGLGNFTLPLARKAREVVGVEGVAGLVQRARENAARNGITNAEFHVANLAQDVTQLPWLKQHYDKILVDPPRSGAIEVLHQLASFTPKRLVYVSCNPATLARDADTLVHQYGYRLVKAGVMDMFPHTAHVESIALFVRD